MDIKPIMSTFGFGHRGARHIVIESEGELWLAAGPGVGGFVIPGVGAGLPGALRFEAIEGSDRAKYTYEVNETLLTAKTDKGAEYKITVDAVPQALRIKGTGALRLNAVEGANFTSTSVTEAGIKITIGTITYFVVVLKGTFTFDDTWILNQFHSVTPVLDVQPVGGEFEIAMYDQQADTDIPELSGTFEEVASKNAEEFKAFLSEIVDIPSEWDDVKEKIAYPLWLCHRVLDGTEVVIENKLKSIDKDQALMSIASLAFKCPKKAVNMMLAVEPSSPLTAAIAAKRLIDENLLNDVRGEIFRVYAALDEAVNFAIKERTVSKDGLSFYAYRYESRKRSSPPAYFSVGEPVLAPDLNAYLTLADDVIGKLAVLELSVGEGKKRAQRSKDRLQRLLFELWNGEDFIGKNAYTGETSAPDDELSLVPIILGKLLPDSVITKLSEKIGIGNTTSAFGLLLVSGLYDAGVTDKAKELTTAALENARREGISCPYYGASLLALAHKVL